MNDTTYNGWANRETWTVLLWVDNEEYSYDALYKWATARLRKGRTITGTAVQSFILRNLYDRNGDGISMRNSRIRWGEIGRAVKANAEEMIEYQDKVNS